ncbi:MAG TPA: penicillin-binding protein activator [Gammaproteobacteria bacterium]|nr:penicillin-binding protein activator [Gammaproteobacteria bacterium]
MVAKSLRLGFSCLCLFALSGCISNEISSMSASVTSLTAQPATTKTSGPVELGPQPQPTQVALLVPLMGGLANAGKAIQAGFKAGYGSSAVHPTIKVYDTSSGDITSIYQQALKEGANYVVGPLDKPNVSTLANSGDIKVDTIALNDVQNNTTVIPNFYEFSLSPSAEAQQAADKASQDGYRKALLITPSGSWGDDIAKALQTQWQKDGGTIAGSLSVSNDENLSEKIQSLAQNYDVVFLIARPSLAREIKPLLAKNMPVYGTSLIFSGLLDSAKDTRLNGVMFCDEPLVLDSNGQWASMRQALTLSQPVVIQQYIRLYGLGFDAAVLTQNFSAINSGISGATGQLSLSSDQHIVRRLSWAKFQKGIPIETL